MVQRRELVHLVVKIGVAVEHAQRVMRIIVPMHRKLPMSTHICIEDHLLKTVVCNVVVGVIILIAAVSHLLLQLNLALDQVLNLALSDF